MKAIDSNARGADKYNWVANEIRRKIAVGQLAPGSQLPQRGELEASFQVSKVTLQRAMNMLIEDGFIAATRSKGSFVVDNPPHLSRYALVFQGQMNRRKSRSQFWVALSQEAMRRERQGLYSVPTYHGIDGHTDTPEFQKLSREISEHRLAGLVYVSDYTQQPDLSLALDMQLPCVALQNEPHPQVPVVMVGEKSFLLRSLDYVAAQGCQRVAFLRHGGDLDLDYLPAELEARGLRTERFWMQRVNIDLPLPARNCMNLLMHPGQIERPDAVIITDDNLVEPATLGLVDAGIKASGDIVVVAHTNFPWLTPNYVEVQRLGYDVRQMFSACIENIGRQRRGERMPATTEIAAQFEHEIDAQEMAEQKLENQRSSSPKRSN